MDYASSFLGFLPTGRRSIGVTQLLNNYVRAPRILHEMDGYVVPPWLAENAGVLGALALAQLQLERPVTSR